MRGQPVALCSQREKKVLEAAVVDRSLAKKETGSLSADGLRFRSRVVLLELGPLALSPPVDYGPPL